jgi:sulfur carrier protein ThiS
MQQQRTIYSNQQSKNTAAPGMATIAAFGMQHHVAAGRSVEETLRELNLSPKPHQAVRVNAEEIHDLAARTLNQDDTVTLTNVVRGGI